MSVLTRVVLGCLLLVGSGSGPALAQSSAGWGPKLDLEASGPRADGSDNETRVAGRDDRDPWESFNRRVHRFNMGVDRFALRPVARGYRKITPQPIRTGISNFFANLGQPLAAVNMLLQGRPGQAGAALGRFTVNATFGLGGFFDAATRVDIPFRDADFGQTLGRWGWRDSRYLVMPVFGPGTIRDVGGRLLTSRTSAVRYVAEEVGYGVSLMYGIDARAQALQFDGMLAEAEDDYLLLRDAYLQRRRCQIEDCSEDLPDYLLPEYDYEIPDVDFGEFRR
jgi:phospholipid-binding lipoprotein MlaA